jgi:hypothetical protein
MMYAGVMLEEQRFPLLECIIHDTNSHHSKKNKQVPQSNCFIATIKGKNTTLFFQSSVCGPTWPLSSEYWQTCTCFVERRKTKRKERQGAILSMCQLR